MNVNGTCHCGRITYEADVDPAKVNLCNCTDCQVITGTAYRVSVTVDKADFRLLTGQPKVYVKTAESGNKRWHAFCPDCSSPIYATAPVDDPPSYTLRVGCLDQKANLPPKRQIWCKSALQWSSDVSSVPGIERQ